MTRHLFGFICLLALGVMGCSETAGTGGVAGNLFPCTEQGILDAVAKGGGPHTFDCDGLTTVVRPTPFVIDNDVILDGNGELVVERGPWSQVGRQAGLDRLPVFQVGAGVTAELVGLSISGGGTRGLGVSNEGRLTLRDSEVFGSEGVGIENSGTMVLSGSTVSEREVEGADGIINLGAMTVVESKVDASDTAILNSRTLELVASTLTGSMHNSGTLAATGSTLTAGVSNTGSLSFVNSTIRGGGPAIASRGVNPWVKSNLSLTSSTVSAFGNEEEPAILIGVGTAFEMAQSIIEGGCAATEDQRETTWTSKGYNLESPGDTCRLEEDSDLVGVNPAALMLLGYPFDNGGPTETMGLEYGSAAIDVVPAESCAVDEDQRGVTRPQGEACDIGAFEWDGPVGEACVPSQVACTSGEIDLIEETCEIIVPDQPSACDGNESVENPTSCTPSGITAVHKLTKMQIARDCNTGFELDSCDGNSCSLGGLAPGEGVGGIDNALAGLAPLLENMGWNLGPIDQAFHDAICTAGIDIEIEVDAVPAESCAVVTVSADGVPGAPIPMHLSDDGCLSGTLGTIPIAIGDQQLAIDNAVVRMTVSPTGFSDGLLGGTANPATAVALFEEVAPGGGVVVGHVGQTFDLHVDLSGNSLTACGALSMAFDIGGSVEMEMLP